MNRFHADRFMSIALLLDRMSFVQPEHGYAPVTDETKNTLRPMLNDVRADCETVGLRLSTKQIDRIESLLDLGGTTVGQLANSLAELHNRIGDEIQDSRFVQIPPGKTAFLDGMSVADSLGVELADATTDLEDAGKCIAFGMNTAAAFHLMRVTEYCLRKFGDHLGVDFSERMSWGPVIAEIDGAIKNTPGAAKEALAQVLTQFISVKNAWRNPTMHVGRSYDDGQIFAIYMSVRFLIDSIKPTVESAGDLADRA